MNGYNILLPNTIVIITDTYNEQSIAVKTLKAIDLSHEQKNYDLSLLSGYQNCKNYKCDYTTEKNDTKFCPYCGSKLTDDFDKFPTVYNFCCHLQSKGLIEFFYDIKHHNTQY